MKRLCVCARVLWSRGGVGGVPVVGFNCALVGASDETVTVCCNW
jgi:hypothetical protein